MRITIMLLAALRRGASLNPERLKHVPKGWRVAAPSAADAAVWLKKSFSSAFPVVAVVAEVAAEVEDADGAAAETKAAKSLLQGRGGRHPNC